MVEVTDTGNAFQILDAIDEANNVLPEKDIIGKRGLTLVSKMAYDITYQRENNKNNTRFKIK